MKKAEREARTAKAMKAGKLTVKKYKKTEITTPKAIKRRLKLSEAIPCGRAGQTDGHQGQRTAQKNDGPGS